MDKITIITNNIPRDIITSWDLTDAERKEFDWMDFTDENQSNEFFRYKGQVHALENYMSLDDESEQFAGWHGYSGDSYFSGTLVKLVNDNEQVIVGRYYQ